MNAILEEEAESVSEVRKRESYNAKIKENYKKLMEGDASDLKEKASETNAKERYESLNAFRPLHERREITFEDVQVPESFMATVQANPQGAVRQTVRTAENILTSREYVEAANRMAEMTGAFAPVAENPVYAASAAVIDAPTIERPVERPMTRPAESASASVANVDYAKLLKTVIAAFAVTAVMLLIVIAVNSAVLRGMDVQLQALNASLEVVKSEVAALEAAIDEETAWESILEFIKRVGMVLK